MMEFLYHDGIKNEIAATERRFRNIQQAISAFERLCEVQFNPMLPKQVIAPAKLHRVTQNDIWTMWKVELVVSNSGLRPNQYPRVWFAVKGSVLVFLCFSTHMDNYNTKECTDVALSRVTDFF
ncbi:MAG: hypothetical protein A2909_03260 [Candidatus Tagabacteria bacterium RIFCSPLOWO2_01_FULL_39_11]|uniref:Addiction module toxin RelE n=1 Tax=Candidatus Tagabacteria bacterium RIFCSPLOWO2_01_FULL_39_11 TaxID=1802295 RepID=A0A1G2LT45_9BACT|nr:MAG: hypothetical protein A2909_03260 [Candidatus Tagabacteria bacterium RIFCSPLOWO2_01_FULL_39_11]